MHDFCKAIEIYFAELFNCERVNVVLVHRVKQHLYRIEQDTLPGTYKFVKNNMQAGLAGFVCVTARAIITEAV